MSFLVSVIIPVYNLEKYIENCLNSIIGQTYRNIEIICVDDGSTDLSAEIVKRIASTDDRIKYFRQENSGVSAARNHALEKANGEYIMFVDGDDYLHPQAVDIFVGCAAKTKADVVCSDYKRTKKTDEVFKPIEKTDCAEADFSEIFLAKRGLQLGETVWGKLIKRELCADIRFNEDLHYSEDTLFTVEVFKNVSSVCMLNHELYYYLARSDSAVSSDYNLKRLTTLTAYDRMCELTADCENGILRFFCLKGLFKYMRYSRMKTRFSKIKKQAWGECRRLGKKWLKVLLKERAASKAQKIMIFVFYHSQLSYEIAMLIKEPHNSWAIYKKRWKDRYK